MNQSENSEAKSPGLEPQFFTIRDAIRDDVPEIHTMLGELAEFEKLTHQFVGTVDEMAAELFDREGGPSALVAVDSDAGLIAYAIYFENFSTFLCRRGIYLEDIYVRPAYRRQGIGKSLLRPPRTHRPRNGKAAGWSGAFSIGTRMRSKSMNRSVVTSCRIGESSVSTNPQSQVLRILE